MCRESSSATRRAGRRSVGASSGWARNTPEGTVEAAFEGDDEAVEAMVEFVRGGPGHADVSQVEVHKEAAEGLSGFDIRG